MHLCSVETLSPQLGRAIRRHRVAVDLSQEDLAECAWLQRNYIGLVERGDRTVTVDALARIAAALGLLQQLGASADPSSNG